MVTMVTNLSIEMALKYFFNLSAIYFISLVAIHFPNLAKFVIWGYYGYIGF